MSSPPHSPWRIWVSAAGTGTALGIVQTAGARFGDRVRFVVADMYPRHLVAASAFAADFVQVPPVSDPTFGSALLSGLSDHCVDAYIPVLDEEIVLAASLREAGRLPVRMSIPSMENAERCFDKLAGSRWMEAHRIPTPHTLLPADVIWAAGKLFAKPRNGRGSVGAYALETEADLERLRERSDVIVQIRCDGPEVTVDAFRSLHTGSIRSICRERLEVKAGVCTKARVFRDSMLEQLAARIADAFGLRGAFCFQAMRHHDGWMVTDVNPRPGAGTRLSVACGFDVLSAMIADLFEEDPSSFLEYPESDRHVVRFYSEVVLA